MRRTLLRGGLLESQQRGRVGPRGATSGQAAGERGHNRQHRNYEQAGHRVARRDAYEYRSERAAHGARQSQPDHESYRESPHALKEHEAPQARPARAHRGSYGHLARALVHGLGNHGIQTHGRERQGENRQDGKHRAEQAHVGVGRRDMIGEGTHAEYWKVRIQVLHALPKGGGEALRSDPRPRRDDHVTTRVLPKRQIYSGKPLAVAVLNDISRDADNRRPGFGSPTIYANAFSERILAGPMPVGEALIDDRGLVARRPVDLRELASQYQSRLHTSEISGADGQHG